MFTTAADKQMLDEIRKAYDADKVAKLVYEGSRKKYRYNIQQSESLLLEDIRNFHNFRGTYDEFYRESDSKDNLYKFNSALSNGTGPSRSYYMSNGDFLFSNSIDIDPDNISKPEVQPIILNEFQPNELMYLNKIVGQLTKKLGDAVDKLGDAFAKGNAKTKAIAFFGSFAGYVGELAGKGAHNILLNKYSIDPGSLYETKLENFSTGTNENTTLKDAFGVRKNPVNQVLNLFQGGKWLNTYELPFFNDMYLQAKSFQYWQTGNLASSFGDSNDGVAKYLKDGINIDFPMEPTFRIPDIGNSGHEEITFEFYLINKNNYWLDRNFRFLQAFYAGTQWLQMEFGFIQGSNVYNVLCPGRFNLIWASVGSKVTFVGKLRHNTYMSERYSDTIKSITKDVLWPDAWKVEIHIKDLTPNNFNMYMNYFINGSGTTFTEINNITKAHNKSFISSLLSGNYNEQITEMTNRTRDDINAKLKGNNANNVYSMHDDIYATAKVTDALLKDQKYTKEEITRMNTAANKVRELQEKQEEERLANNESSHMDENEDYI